MNFSSLRILSVVLALVFLGFSRSEAQVTNLLTSFSDNFNRTNGAIGTNYTLGAGTPYVITNNQLLRTGTDEALTFLNVGALPTAAQFDGGSSYSSGFRQKCIWLRVAPDSGSASYIRLKQNSLYKAEFIFIKVAFSVIILGTIVRGVT